MHQHQKQILIIISASVAAYKSLDLIRMFREKSYQVVTVLTQGAKNFITPMSVGSLSGNEVYDDLFSLKDETEIGHIRLAREADLVIVSPATADIIGKLAGGLANDLASTILLATDKPVIMAPAMNPVMWQHKSVQRNVNFLREIGINFVGPESGTMACGETGLGRLASNQEIIAEAERILCLKD